MTDGDNNTASTDKGTLTFTIAVAAAAVVVKPLVNDHIHFAAGDSHFHEGRRRLPQAGSDRRDR